VSAPIWIADAADRYRVDRPRVFGPGLRAKPTRRGVVVLDLHYSADPDGVTPELVVREMRRLGCEQRDDGTWSLSWRWLKEMELDWVAQSSAQVFDSLEQQEQHILEPAYYLRYEIPHDARPSDEARLIECEPGEVGPIRVWISPLDQPGNLPDGAYVQRSFGVGSDISEGVGASDSTVVVFTADTREHAAVFADNTIRPVDVGRVAVALCRYYNNALLCMVRKMHGISALREVLDLGYTRVWREKVQNRAVEYAAENYGWPKGEASSPQLFGRWQDALRHQQVTLHDAITLDQHRQYLYDEHGRISHSALRHLPVEVRQRHGDLVIGAALAYRAVIDLPKYQEYSHDTSPPELSMAWRRQQRELRRQRDRALPYGEVR